MSSSPPVETESLARAFSSMRSMCFPIPACCKESVPESLAIIGAGVVGLEMGSVWRRLGSNVTLFESQPALLAGADRQIAQEAQKQLTRQGLTIFTGATVRQVRPVRGGVSIEYDDARGR